MVPSPQQARTRFLAVTGHLMALLFILGPLVGLLLASAVPGPEGIVGRARMVTIAVDSGLWVMLGVFTGLALSSLLEQRGLQWTYSAVSALLGVAFLIAVPMFIMDVLQLRGSVRPEMRTLYDGNMLRNLATLSASAVIYLGFAFTSIRALRRERMTVAPAGPGVLAVGQMRRPDAATPKGTASAPRR